MSSVGEPNDLSIEDILLDLDNFGNLFEKEFGINDVNTNQKEVSDSIPVQLSKIDSLLGNLHNMQKEWEIYKQNGINLNEEDKTSSTLNWSHKKNESKNSDSVNVEEKYTDRENNKHINDQSTKDKVRNILMSLDRNSLLYLDDIHIFNKLISTGQFSEEEDITSAIHEVKLQILKSYFEDSLRKENERMNSDNNNETSLEKEKPVENKSEEDQLEIHHEESEKNIEDENVNSQFYTSKRELLHSSYILQKLIKRESYSDSSFLNSDELEEYVSDIVDLLDSNKNNEQINENLDSNGTTGIENIKSHEVNNARKFSEARNIKSSNIGEILEGITSSLEAISPNLNNNIDYSTSLESDDYFFTLEYERLDEMEKIMKNFELQTDLQNIHTQEHSDTFSKFNSIPKFDIGYKNSSITNFVGSFESEKRMKTYEVPISTNNIKAPKLQLHKIHPSNSDSIPLKVIVPSANNRIFECIVEINQTISSLKLFVWVEVLQVQNVVLEGNISEYVFRAEHDDYFIDEKLLLSDTPYFIHCRRNELEIQLNLVSRNDLIQMENQIEEILGHKLVSSFEAYEFRKEMQRIVYHSMRSCYKRIRVAKKYEPIPGIENHLPKNFNVHVWFKGEAKDNKEKKFITCDLHFTGKRVLLDIMEEFPYEFHGKSENYKDYILKIRGIDEYIMEDNELISVEWIRNALRKRKRIDVVVLEKDDLDEDTKDFLLSYESMKNNGDFNLDLNHVLNRENLSSQYFKSSWDVSQPLKLLIKYLDPIPFDPRLFKMPKKRNDLIEIYIKCSVIYGFNERIGPVVRSAKLIYHEDSLEPFDFQSLKENIWIELAPLNTLPLRAKILFEVIAKLKSLETTIAHSEFNIFDSMKMLKYGQHEIICKFGEPSSDGFDYIEEVPKLTFEVYKDDLIVIYPECNFTPSSNDTSTNIEDPPENILKILTRLFEADALYMPTKEERDIVWKYREWAKNTPDSISMIMLSVPWSQPTAMKELYKLLDEWPPLKHPLNAIILLGKNFSDPKIREFAVRCLNRLSDDDISEVLLQLVQALKHEYSHDSALSRFLILKALFNQNQIGQLFFWHLRACLQDPIYRERYLLISEVYLRYCSKFRSNLQVQTQFYTSMITIAKELKKVKEPSKRKPFLQEQLQKLKFQSNSFQIPVDCHRVAKSFRIEKCKSLESKTLPLWLVCENADPLGDDHFAIMKVGDDLRQDQLTLQMFRIMDKLWLREGLDLKMSPYLVIETGNECGMIEVIPESHTNASIQKEYGGITAAFSEKPLAEWLKKYNPNESEYKSAVRDFIRSCAGYCVATYVLGIGDRHNDNIMCTKSGHLFHIDFGRFLGNTEKFVGMSRDRAPFVFTPEFAYVMGGVGSPNYKTFVELCKSAYIIIRKHARLFISLFSMMLQIGIPELRGEEDINYLRESFALNLTDEKAGKVFEGLIEEALKTKSTQFNFAVHILANPDRK